jgi:hypothetical protein
LNFYYCHLILFQRLQWSFFICTSRFFKMFMFLWSFITAILILFQWL